MTAATTREKVKEADQWAAALGRARAAEAAHQDAVQALRDAKSIRLQLLKDDLGAVLAASSEARQVFDLALMLGEPPRLWIDLVSFVVMEPDARTYRLLRDSEAGRDILAETGERAEMVAAVRQHMAHRLIARQRGLAERVAPIAPERPTGWSLTVAGLSGFAAGALALLAALIALNLLKF
ncbi:MAG: hypothetical protein HY245_08295 [Rhizobiales bacterium]|nr:hypothetical protein [Hyphomicrobiales bacterium]MBI3673404.1 hypothetical protein [Hyphomicrobiales bacterium]